MPDGARSRWCALAGPAGGSVRCVHFVIMGCGRVGATLAQSLESSGHSVAVVDQNPDAFRRLPAEFTGKKVTGVGFDRDTLVQAGIEDAYAFAAVSDGDNSNILSARVVRETFGVEKVVARIYDPQRAEIYQRLGIPTVATVRCDLRPGAAPHAPVRRDRRDPATRPGACGWPRSTSTPAGSAAPCAPSSTPRPVSCSSAASATPSSHRTVLQENDVLHVLMDDERAAVVERKLTHAPKVEAE